MSLPKTWLDHVYDANDAVRHIQEEFILMQAENDRLLEALTKPLRIEVCKGQAGLALYVNDTRVAGVRDNGLMETVLHATVDCEALAKEAG